MKRLLSTAPLLLVACGAPDPLPTVPDPAAAVVAAPVEAPAVRPDFPGVITAKVSKVIPAEFAGRLEKIFVHQRQRVKEGEIVAKLDPTELQTQAASLRAQEARGQVGAASGPGLSARVQRQQLEAQIKKAALPSPIDGVIMIVKVKEGEMMSRGLPIARVFDDRDLTIRFAVPKDHKHLVKLGGRVELSLAGLERPIWADITQISDEEPSIAFTVVEADIDDAKLRPGEIQVASEGRVRIADTARVAHDAVPLPTTTSALEPVPQPQPAPAGANQ